MSVELAMRAAALLGAGSALCWMMRPFSAATRHAIWRLTVVATLALPLIAPQMPTWSLTGVLPPTFVAATEQSGAGVTGTGSVLSSVVTEVAAEPEEGWSWIEAVRTGTMVGSIGVATYFLVGYLRLWLLRRRSSLAPASWTSAVARLAARSRLNRSPRVLVTSVPSPCVTGIFSPAVLVPAEALDWSEARREAVLIHELAHVSRGDIAAQLASQVLLALHWFNPLAWRALREMRRERELACDEEVLRAGVPPVAYATDLLAIAAANAMQPLPALSVARRSDLEERLLAVLDGPVSCGGRFAHVSLSLLVALATVIIAGGRLKPLAAEEIGTPRSWSGRTSGWTIALSGGEDMAPVTDASDIAAPDSTARERATAALAFSSGPDAVPPLLQALGDEDARVREKAAIGLAWRRDARIAHALIAAAGDPDPRVREKVLVALAFSGDRRAHDVIMAARSDPDSGVREKATKLALIR